MKADVQRGRRKRDLASRITADRREKSNPQRRPDEKNTRSGKQKIRCFSCRKIGYKANVCPSKDRGNDAGVVEQNYYFSEEPTEEANRAEHVSTLGKWCLDSGCTSHMCQARTELHDTKKGVRVQIKFGKFDVHDRESKRQGEPHDDGWYKY